MQISTGEILLVYDMTCKVLDYNSKFYMPYDLEHYLKLKEKLENEIKNKWEI